MTTVPSARGIVTGVDLVASLTADPKASIAFYRDVLGLTPTELDDAGRGAEFELADGTTFGVWMPDDGPKSGTTIMFAVADIKRAIDTFRANGAQLSDPEETPVCFMAFGADPDGNPFMIHERKPDAA